MDAGRTIKGVAQALGGGADPKTQRRLERRVRETLRILTLPETVQTKVADGTVPARAVKTLGDLAKIHPELAARAVAVVVEQPNDGWAEPWTWEELIDDPIHAIVAARADDELPAGVSDAHGTHPAGRFALGEEAQRELEELCALTGHTPATSSRCASAARPSSRPAA